jgi:hypothetical protein
MTELDDLNRRLTNVIINTCNQIGCDNCDLKWEEDGREQCSATSLQDKIFNIEHGG